GSDPGRAGLFDGTHDPWLDREARCYGFPLDWLVPDSAPEPERALDPRLSGPMTARMGAGDTAVNLAAAGLVLVAWMLTGDPRYRDWIEQYAGAWRERAAANHGVIPDNTGPDGVVGSLLDGRWYGGHYGWSWPHGWYSVGSAAMIAALAAATVTGDDDYLDLVRPALDTMIENGKVMAYDESDSSLASKWHPQLAGDVTAPTLLVPYRHSDRGWFDYNPMLASVPVALCDPVVPAALVQRTWGGPQVIYNGGLQQARVRYYDAARGRPGLPASVAALVSGIDPQATVVDLVNLDPEQERTAIVQAGAFAEHTIEAVRYTACPDRAWVGRLYDYGHGEPAVTEHRADVRGPWLTIRLPGSTRIRLTLTMDLRTRPPSYAAPFGSVR